VKRENPLVGESPVYSLHKLRLVVVLVVRMKYLLECQIEVLKGLLFGWIESETCATVNSQTSSTSLVHKK
jgi:hypothetical protein